MVCDGPEPPEDSIETVTPPPSGSLPAVGAGAATDSDDDTTNDYAGYEPLPQGPEGFLPTHADDDYEEDEVTNRGSDSAAGPENLPPIDSTDREITREVWSAPRHLDPIQMDNERAQQVMSAMANFVLPQTSIPEWAQSISEDQWKQRLKDKIDTLRTKPQS